ncbi:hypothetical protein [Novosphingobium sp.]|uniref:hypothetical protein n=1 Tax=Novosphingobium sp. TaxID=1874826 RepID=UPI0025CC8EF8|nr:hypothetical protein [Novosphingobium sp.]
MRILDSLPLQIVDNLIGNLRFGRKKNDADEIVDNIVRFRAKARHVHAASR